MPVNVLYLVWGEDVVDNGIIHNQVFEQLKLIKELEPGIELVLLAGLPLSRSYLKSPRRYKLRLARLKAELEAAKVRARFVTLPVLPRFFYSRAFTLPLFYTAHLLLVRRLIREHHIDIVHCRSYHAANLMRWARRLLGVSCKLVFDPRSLFVDEGLLFGAFGEGSLHHKLWQGTE
ncbi:MAG: glycosyltransferase, partial [Deinococcota bacterium]|nr:glycosyltransferase [Deinococcota bacterium]